MQLESLPEVQGEAVAQQEPANGERATIAGDVLAPACERGVEQSQHVELVCDEPRVRKESLGKSLVDVAHVECDEPHILATWDVRESTFELGNGSAIDDLHQPLASEVDDHRDEVARSKLLVSSEEVLVEADDVGPWIEMLATFELEVPIERRVQKTGRTTEVSSHLLQVAVELARAK